MQRVSYGMPQLIELNSVEENVRLCSQLGLDFIELNCNLPSCQPETMNVHYLNLLKDQYGIKSFILHFQQKKLSYTVNINSNIYQILNLV